MTDFGTSKQVENMTTTKTGTPYYMSPTMHLNTPYNPFSADLWSMGIFLYELATGQVPYDAKNR